ncbi:MAG: ribonuclease R [Lactobacillaceae bacterium]|jgi:ribonuclease R|nr:ribonuclease R [Lactobacillaceae bacterium]
MAEIADKFTGRFQANEKGFGFVKTEGEDPDLFIGRDNTMLAMNGDTVTAEIIKLGRDGREPEGKVDSIETRAAQDVVGVFHVGSQLRQTPDGRKIAGTLEPMDKKLASYNFYVLDGPVTIHDRDAIVATATDFPTSNDPKQVVVLPVSLIGRFDAPGVDILEIVNDLKIPTDFTKEARDEAAQIPDTVDAQKALAEGRQDIRDQTLITIDGADTKDIDDAVVAWKLPNGNYHLGVHIADVSNYVQPRTALDENAYDRGTSVYLTDRVIPMTPPSISNGIASLNPDVDRLAVSAEMEIDGNGSIVNHELHTSLIRSHARMTYVSVNEILDGVVEEREKYAELVPMIETMAEIHKILADKRKRRGAIEFDTPEAQIIVDQNGKPTDILVRERGIAERMIESMMLAANETVAEHFDRMHVPFLYRVHETPEGEKVTKFFEFMTAIGHPISADPKKLKPRDFQKALDAIAGSPEEAMVTTMMLRATKQAKYSPDPIGHFGIGADYYTHFTSPIRRYPDLVVHRLIKLYAQKGHGAEVTDAVASALPKIAEDTSTKERRAVDAERATNDMKMAEYMETHIGEVYQGVVNSALKFGLFVSLENTVEGLVHISTMEDDIYQYDESRAALIGRNKHHIFTIGQKVQVQVTRASKEERKIDFKLLNPDDAPLTKIRLEDDKRPRRDFKKDNKKQGNHAKNGGFKSTGKYAVKGRR